MNSPINDAVKEIIESRVEVVKSLRQDICDFTAEVEEMNSQLQDLIEFYQDEKDGK